MYVYVCLRVYIYIYICIYFLELICIGWRAGDPFRTLRSAVSRRSSFAWAVLNTTLDTILHILNTKLLITSINSCFNSFADSLKILGSIGGQEHVEMGVVAILTHMRVAYIPRNVGKTRIKNTSHNIFFTKTLHIIFKTPRKVNTMSIQNYAHSY